MRLYAGIKLTSGPDLDNIARLDALILPGLNRMSRVGIAVDVPYLHELSSQFAVQMDTLQKDISSYIPKHALDQFAAQANLIEEEQGLIYLNAGSAEQIRVLLFGLLKVGRDRKLKSTGTGKQSTGRKNLDLIRDDHPAIPLVIKYREISKLRQSFTDSLPDMVMAHPRGDCPICELHHCAPTNRLHTTFTTTSAITGRLSSRKPNLQQIPIRTPEGMKIRSAFIASPGLKLVSVDFSQMEIRDLAHLANAQSIIRVYCAGGDIHLKTAMASFGIADPARVDKYQHRLPAKRVNFGIQNGTTEKGLHAQLVSDYWAAGIKPPDFLTQEWCKQFIEKWHGNYPEVQPYFERQYYRARRYGFVWGICGRTRYIPQVRSTHYWKVAEGLREAQNFAVTNANAEQTKLAHLECEEHFADMRQFMYAELLLSIHDQLIAEVEEDCAEVAGEDMTAVFEHVMDDRKTGESLWRCPIKSDCEILDRWKEIN